MLYSQPPLNSVRVACENWMEEERFFTLLALLKEHPAGISQITLFTSIVHTPLCLDELQKRANLMKLRMEQARNAGFSSGINILATIGHHNEDLEYSLHGKFQNMMNIQGEICDGCYCMNDTQFLTEHIVPTYHILASAQPDYIWIDDDIRYGHMPIGNGCFCNHCIQIFNEANGTSFTREELRAAWNRGDLNLRKQWLTHNSKTISRLFSLIGTTVRSHSDRIMLGFMTGERYFEGYDFEQYADALSQHGTYEIMWRPGGGAYSDVNFDAITEKAEQIGRQNAYLPPYVTVIQAEIENFPYQILKKTAKSTAVEAAMDIACGCTGAAFNILPSESGEPLKNIEKHLKKITEVTPFYALLREKLHGSKPYGIHTGWRTDSQAAVPAGEWVNLYGGMYADYARELFSFGLPQSFHTSSASVVTLTGGSIRLMSDTEIKELLSGGVYLNASAAKDLWERGFGALIGFRVGAAVNTDAREQYTSDPVNEGIVHGIRNGRQAFNPGDSFAILPQYESSRSISALIDYHNHETASCCTGLFENELGGRICVAGYYPYHWISDAPKTTQLKRIFTYLSKGTLPSFVEGYARIFNVTYPTGKETTVLLMNTSNDTEEQIAVNIAAEKVCAEHIDMRCQKKLLKSKKATIVDGTTYQTFVIDEIQPYEMVVLTV